MIVKDKLSLYKQYYIDRDNESMGLFTILADRFNIKSAIYPGSFVHITPSFVFPSVTYIDSDRMAKSFFSHPVVYDYINKHRIYSEKPSFTFVPEDYRKYCIDLPGKYDLLISLYAGFISKYCTHYLKENGLLLVNNSHGDASMASISGLYVLVGVFNRRKNKYIYSEDNLETYLIPKRDVNITEDYLESIGKGIGYTKSPAYYLFRKTTS